MTKSRYHLWFGPCSHITPHGVRQRHPLYRAYPSGPIVIRHFQPGRSGRYFGASSYCLAPGGSSLDGKGRLLHPFDAFRYETSLILANPPGFVKQKLVYKNRYANFTNRSLSPEGIWYNMTTTKGDREGRCRGNTSGCCDGGPVTGLLTSRSFCGKDTIP